MKSFSAWLEGLNSGVITYDDLRYKRSEESNIEGVKTALRPFVDTTRFDIAGHGLRGAKDIERVFRLGLQSPNTEFQRLALKVFSAGVPLEKQPTEAFDTLLQWPFANRTNVILIALPAGNHDAVWRDIRGDEEKSFIPTAGFNNPIVKTISPEHILGCFDAAAIKFIPNPNR